MSELQVHGVYTSPEEKRRFAVKLFRGFSGVILHGIVAGTQLFHLRVALEDGPGWAEPGAGFCTYINLDAWNSLPENLQAAFRTAAKAVNSQMYSDYTAKDPAAFNRMVASGTEPRVFNQETLQAFHDSWTRINENLRQSNEMYRRISDSMTAFLEENRPYDERNQHAYESFLYSHAG